MIRGSRICEFKVSSLLTGMRHPGLTAKIPRFKAMSPLVVQGVGLSGDILGLHGDHGKEHGNYYIMIG